MTGRLHVTPTKIFNHDIAISDGEETIGKQLSMSRAADKGDGKVSSRLREQRAPAPSARWRPQHFRHLRFCASCLVRLRCAYS